MLNLTFGEQVKIVLNRKGMTIKELAEQIEESTGMKMSRQNLTQRLGRDNFQEQDMRMIAEILGCSFELSILGSLEELERRPQKRQPMTRKVLQDDGRESGQAAAQTTEQMSYNAASVLAQVVGAEPKATARKELAIEVVPPEEELSPSEREITIGELVDIYDEAEQPVQSEVLQEPEESARQGMTEVETAERESAETAHAEVTDSENLRTTSESAEPAESAAAEDKPKKSVAGKIGEYFKRPAKKETTAIVDGDEEEILGDVNPYTGKEFESNSVRTHPKRIGYVQVYDRSEHKWTDMTEWAFLGYQERKKALLGKDYEPPIYLD